MQVGVLLVGFGLFIIGVLTFLRVEDTMAAIADVRAKISEVGESVRLEIERVEALIALLEANQADPAELDAMIVDLQAIKDRADSERP